MRGRYQESETRKTPVVKNVYLNGEDNLYPNTVEVLIDNSVTASQCSEKMASFLIGKGFGDGIDDIMVNHSKDYTAYDLLNLASLEISRNKGVYFHVNYDVELKPTYDILRFENCRRSKLDDNEKSGKIFYGDYTSRFNNANKERYFYAYNPKESVINEQRRKDCELLEIKNPTPEDLIKNYRGQVYFLTFDNSRIYPLAWINSVMLDCESEYHISLMRNKQIKNGFQKTTLFLTNELSEDDGNDIFKTLQNVSSSKNAGNLAMIELPNFNKDSFSIEQLESNIDDKVVDLTEQRIANNIRKVYRIPKELVDSEKGAIFSASGSGMIEIIKMYWSELNKERRTLEQVFTSLLKPIIPEGTKLKIREIYDTDSN